MKKTAALLTLICLLLVACGGAAERTDDAVRGDGAAQDATGGAGGEQQGSTRRVDPRRDGLEIGMGEWAVTLESGVIRPGRVTFVIANRGTMGHGFEIEAENDDSSGPGSGDGLKAETNLLQPGDTTRVTLDLAPGIYKVECFVDGHDDLGMEAFLEVRENAPLARETGSSGGDGAVSIAGFAFEPADLTVDAATEITWSNEDEAPHTVTAEDGSFDSGTLEPGQTFSTTIEGAGPVTYLCQIHPDMRGRITVR